MTFRLTLGAGGFTRAPHGQSDIAITGKAYDFIELATGQEDYDTLFFNRRLRVEGNTEVGLELKNFLDAQESLLPSAPKMVQRVGDQLMSFWRHWASFTH
jgi:predicted lipid carrier protein YhbT